MKAYRVLATFSAILFGLFVGVGAVALVATLPQTSCAGVSPETPGDAVELVGPGGVSTTPSGGTVTWDSIPSGHCVELTSQNSTGGYQGTDLGQAPTIHGGNGWVGIRIGIGAWVAWTLAMFLLAAAVAAIPAARSSAPPTPGPWPNSQ
jgi:hypothetical protein